MAKQLEENQRYQQQSIIKVFIKLITLLIRDSTNFLLDIMERPNRRYKEDSKTQVINTWSDFLKYRRDIQFPQGFSYLPLEKIQEFWNQKFKDLKNDSRKVYYQFRDDFDQKNRQIAIKILANYQQLDYQYESMFLGNKKQLVIYSFDEHLINYLKKYRLPSVYNGTKDALHKSQQKLDEIIKKRNIAISEDKDSLYIDSLTDNFKKIKEEEYDPHLEKFKKLMQQIIKDFKSQKKKQELLLASMSDWNTEVIKQICQQYQLYYAHRYNNIGKYQKFVDLVVYKIDPHIKVQNSEIQFVQEQQSQVTQSPLPQNIVYSVAKPLQSIQFIKFQKNIALYQLVIPKCGLSNPIQKIVVQNSKGDKQIIEVQQQIVRYEVEIIPYQYGYNTFKFYTLNKIGPSKNSNTISIWFNVDQQLNIIENSSLYLIGKSNDGIICIQEDGVKKISTEQNFKKTFDCIDFSLGTQALLCDVTGTLAGWGRIYCDQEDIDKNQQKQQSSEDQLFGIWQCKTLIEQPCRYQLKEYIRKVSCGQCYSLMCDSFGGAWSFGFNSSGQLGLGHLNQNVKTAEPLEIYEFKRLKAFIVDVKATSWGGSLALDHEGKVYRWGLNQVQTTQYPIKNSYGDIINFKIQHLFSNFQPTPTLLGPKFVNDPVVSMHSGKQCFMVLTKKGEIYGWGMTKYFGTPKMIDKQFNVVEGICNPVPIIKGVSQFSMGQEHGIVRKDGKLLGWGNGEHFNKNNSKWIDQACILQIQSDQVKSFYCGFNYTVFYREQQGRYEIQVIGQKDIFKNAKYSLPGKPVKAECGKGVIGMLIKKK